ncbi:MAG: hypothetical protein ABIE07_04780 [Candidatus Zixiibacteriota bacterium]
MNIINICHYFDPDVFLMEFDDFRNVVELLTIEYTYPYFIKGMRRSLT